MHFSMSVRSLRVALYTSWHFISLQIFELTDFNKKHKSISMKPFNFAVILKLSNAQLQEKVFRVSFDFCCD